ncbi:MAG: cell division protein ZapD [Legionellaceae bacterium]|nr:cell division protein ZapD [Legionellaceae bacterium]
MQDDKLTYQLPVHFLPKVCLKLERLFKNIESSCSSSDPIIHHSALKNLIDIIKIVEKPELKSRFIKEFARIEHLVNKSQTNISNSLYARLFVQLQVLSHLAGRFGEKIHTDPFIQSIRYSQSSQDDDYESQAPQLFFWLEGGFSVRQHNIQKWLDSLKILRETVSVYLAILRENAEFEQVFLQNGFYTKSLSARINYHLILIKMSSYSGIVPKIQLGHHGVSVRLFEAYSMQEINDTTGSYFDLAICQL